jgi:hypothetical protein
MYETNGRPLRLRRTSNLSRLRNAASVMLIKLRELPPPARIGLGLTLLMLVLALMGCAAPSAPAEWPKNPPPPVLSEPMPTESYSSKAFQLIESWRKRVIGM